MPVSTSIVPFDKLEGKRLPRMGLELGLAVVESIKEKEFKAIISHSHVVAFRVLPCPLAATPLVGMSPDDGPAAAPLRGAGRFLVRQVPLVEADVLPRALVTVYTNIVTFYNTY